MQKYEDIARTEGKAEGRAEGKTEERKRSILRMKAANYSDSVISQVLDIPIEEVIAVLKQ